jgi:hypothetical protein
VVNGVLAHFGSHWLESRAIPLCNLCEFVVVVDDIYNKTKKLLVSVQLNFVRRIPIVFTWGKPVLHEWVDLVGSRLLVLETQCEA